MYPIWWRYRSAFVTSDAAFGRKNAFGWHLPHLIGLNLRGNSDITPPKGISAQSKRSRTSYRRRMATRSWHALPQTPNVTSRPICQPPVSLFPYPVLRRHPDTGDISQGVAGCEARFGSPPFRASFAALKQKTAPREERRSEFSSACAGSVAAAGCAAHLHRGVIGIAGRDHLDALARGVLRRDVLVLDARRRDHHGLRHHHGAVLRGRTMRDDGARRHHHGLVDGAVLRRDVLLLVAGLARRRRVAIVAAGGSGSRHRNRSDGRRENNSKSTRHYVVPQLPEMDLRRSAQYTP